VLGPDDALPPERNLASDFGVSRITVRKAIDGLVNEGMLVRLRARELSYARASRRTSPS